MIELTKYRGKRQLQNNKLHNLQKTHHRSHLHAKPRMGKQSNGTLQILKEDMTFSKKLSGHSHSHFQSSTSHCQNHAREPG